MKKPIYKNAVYAPAAQNTFTIISEGGPQRIIGFYIVEDEANEMRFTFPVMETGIGEDVDIVQLPVFHELNEDSPLYARAFEEWGFSYEDGLPYNKDGFSVLCKRMGLKINPSEQSIRDSIEKLGSSCSGQDSPEYCQMVCDRIRELKKDLFYYYGKEY